jgi:hypothetical protein
VRDAEIRLFGSDAGHDQLPTMMVECTCEILAVADIISQILSLTDDNQRREHNLRASRYIIKNRKNRLAYFRWEGMSPRKRHQAWKRLTQGTFHLLANAMVGFTKSERDVLSRFLDGRRTRVKTATVRDETATEKQAPNARVVKNDLSKEHSVMRRLILDRSSPVESHGESDERALALRELWEELKKAND